MTGLASKLDVAAPEVPALDPSVRHRIIRKALLSRAVEETLLQLFAAGKLAGTVHTCIGQEFSGAVLSECFQPYDAVVSNHRCHGHYLSVTGDTDGLIAEVMGKATGTCGGRGGSQHLCRGGFFSNGIQGGIVPFASGLAFARKRRGAGGIATVFIGDGTLGEGVIYECFNIAARWSLPLFVVVENNGVAQSTSSQETLSGDIRARAEAFGWRTDAGSTWEWETLHQIAHRLVEDVRRTCQPAMLVVDTYRLRAHSKGDDDRPAAEVARYAERDPLTLLLRGADPAIVTLQSEVAATVQAAVAAAECALVSVPAEVLVPTSQLSWSESYPPKARMVKRINDWFTAELQADPAMTFIGEDIKSPYGGAFKVSKGLSDAYPDRVINTPISEAAIVGIGAGLGIEGFPAVVEIMFGDFTTLAVDQLVNHAAKYRFMYNEQVNVRLMVRTPMGGRRGYGPTHSQTLDRLFLGVPGLTVVNLHSLVDPETVLRAAKALESPVLVIENKMLYASPLRSTLPQGFRTFLSSEPFPTAHVRPDADRIDVTILAYGGMSDIVVDAVDLLFEEHDIIAQALLPTKLYPFEVEGFMDIIQESRALVIVEEGQGFAAFGAEVIAQMASRSNGRMPRVRRVMPRQTGIPAAASAEAASLPGVEDVVAVCVEAADE